MDRHIVCLILTVLFGTFGFCFLAAGFVSLNPVVGERSRKDGRMFMEKRLSGSLRESWEARREMVDLLPEAWAKQRATRLLVYFGVAFFVVARILGEEVGPLPTSRMSPPQQTVQPFVESSTHTP